MKDNGNNNIPPGFIIQPVHQNYIRNNTYQKVQAIYPAFFHNITLIVITQRSQRHMPYTPKQAENHGNCEQVIYQLLFNNGTRLVKQRHQRC